MQDLTAGLAIAQLDAESHQQQGAAVAVMADAQQRIQGQREEERERQCLDALIEYYSRRSNSPNCPPPSAAPAEQPRAAGAMMVSYGSASAGSSAALTAMLAQPWGQQAADSATRLGVNPDALASNMKIESNFQNVAARDGGTIRGVNQMRDSTFQAAARQAGISTDLAGQMDPAIQSAAAAQELKNAATQLRSSGVAQPTLLQARTLYQWGAGAGPAVAAASPETTMAAALPGYNAAVLQANGIRPGQTVGEWRTALANRLGPAANQPVLLGTLRSA